MTPHDNQLILLAGGTGTTGRRIADRLRARALGRDPVDFGAFVTRAAAGGAWRNVVVEVAR